MIKSSVCCSTANPNPIMRHARFPALLTSLRHIDQLIELAFDERVPPGASKVSQRDIRLSRIVAALELCAKIGRRDDLLRLLLEASIIAAGHERSDRFLYDYPDLAAVAGDAEALRRLFSTRAGWPGGIALALAQSARWHGRGTSQRAAGDRLAQLGSLPPKADLYSVPGKPRPVGMTSDSRMSKYWLATRCALRNSSPAGTMATPTRNSVSSSTCSNGTPQAAIHRLIGSCDGCHAAAYTRARYGRLRSIIQTGIPISIAVC